MTEEPKPQTPEPLTKSEIRERQKTARRVYLDPSTPSVRSITRVVVIGLLLMFVAGFVHRVLSSLTFLFFIIVVSVFFAYLMDPLVRAIRRPFKERGLDRLMPRAYAIIVAYLFVFSVLGFAIATIAPRVSDQARDFGSSLPGFTTAIRQRATELNRRLDRMRLPDEVQSELGMRATDMGSRITAAVSDFVLVFFSYLPWFLLVPILAFFFLKDVNLFRLSLLRLFPAGRWRHRAEVVIADLHTTLAAYTRAQLISCILIGALCTIGFYFIGLKYALLLGILAGILEFIPLLGPATVGLIVTATAAASDNPWRALHVAIFLIVLRIIHDYVTYPRIVRDGVHLHPLAIILSVLAGEQVAGIPGVFISIPIVAVISVIYRHVQEHRGSSGLLSGIIKDAENPPEEVV